MVMGDCFGGGWREMKDFVRTVVVGPWFMVFSSLLIMAISGTGYLFGLYSNDVKTSLGYDQTTLNLLSFFKDVGGNVGILSGLINEVSPPWVVLSIGAIMNFFGYFMIWVSVTGRIADPKVWQMCVYMCLSANAQAFSNTGALVTCVQNFPESRGGVIGLLKGFVGLSGAIMTQFYHAFYGDNSKALILLLAWFPTSISVIFLRFVRVMKIVREAKNPKFFYNLFYISLSLASLLMVLIILQKKFSFTRIEYIGSASLVAVLLFLPIAIIVKEEYHLWQSNKAALNENLPPLELTILPSEPSTPPTPTEKPPASLCGPPDRGPAKKFLPSCVENIFKPPTRGEDYTILQALFSVDMLVLFVATTCGIGGALTAIDNLGQIGKSLGYPTRSIATFVSLVSIWNYLGRAVAGFASEILLTNYNIPRPLLFTIVLLFTCIGHLLIAFGVPNSLYFASVIIGFCFGAQLPLMFAIISELFGLKYYSTLFNFGAVASPLGTYVLNVIVAGHLYDKEAVKQLKAEGLRREAGKELICNGVQCYKISFLVITAITIFGSLISLVLVLRTRNFYRGDIYKKFREEAVAAEK